MVEKIRSIRPFGWRPPAPLFQWLKGRAFASRRSVNAELTMIVEQKRAAEQEKAA